MTSRKSGHSAFSQLELLPDKDSELLIEETRQLFDHQGSDGELLELVMSAIDAIDRHCHEPIVEPSLQADVA